MPKFLRLLAVSAFCLPPLVSSAAPPDSIAYRLSWDAPNSHLLRIEMTVTGEQSPAVDFRLPSWRPGRYIIQDFVKNLRDFRAVDETGRPLPFRRLDKATWRVERRDAAAITVTYGYYARQLDAGASYLDDSEAYVNPITCFMYVPGLEQRPVSLQISKPADWRIAAVFEQQYSETHFASSSYHEFVDVPILISPSFELLSFEHQGTRFELALQGESNHDPEKLIDDVRKIVVEQVRIMQDLPMSRYLFMYHLVPYRFGHGVEHKNSTSIVRGPMDFDNPSFYNGFLSVTSHEFFHVWNVERIRPEAIYEPDYASENYTTTLWIYEGITSYYSGLTLVRTGLTKVDGYLSGLANSIRGYERSYGRHLTSVADVSWDSWTKGAGGAPPNSYYSFYTKGMLLGLVLDLHIRHLTKNKRSLNDVMRYLNDTYAKKNRGVPENGFELALRQVVGRDFDRFFADHVYGTVALDFDRYLRYAGLALQKEPEKKTASAWTGLQLRGDDEQTRVSNVIPESPADEAGLAIDDILLAIDGRRTHNDNFDLRLRAFQPGDSVVVTVFRRERLRNFGLLLAEAPPELYTIKAVEEPDALQQRIRRDWLNEQETEGEDEAATGGR